MRTLLVGGAGYVGTHTAVALIDAGHDVIVVDDLSHASREALNRVQRITDTPVPLLVADARDRGAIENFVRRHAPVDAVVLLAGLKSVGESVADPLRYYDVNVGSAVSVFTVATAVGIPTVVFSSSATVYRADNRMPLTEESATGLDLANPYGKTKRVIEEILADAARSDSSLRAVSLRYFNPVGAHESGLIGEDPTGSPTNVMPIISRAAAGALPRVDIFGDDYDTPDGTGLRDYIHVSDLAVGHVAAIEHAGAGYSVYNLGTGRPTSVLELIAAFESESGSHIERRVVGRRPGDVATSFTDPEKAHRDLGWTATRTVRDAARDQWRWQTMNPSGFRDGDDGRDIHEVN